ncbi:MAG: hypothetical protein ACU0DW_04225 [Shimia sp.]
MRFVTLLALALTAACTLETPEASAPAALSGPAPGLSTVTYVGDDGCTYQDELHNGVKFRQKRLSC